jgi:hypothetical protein
VLLAAAALIPSACGSTAPSGPTASAGVPSAIVSTPLPAEGVPSPSPTTGATAATGCAIEPQDGGLPSDRLIEVVIGSSATADLVMFVFGDPSVPAPPQGAATGSLAAAEPPYTGGASGLPVDVEGEHVAQIRFSGMSLMNDIGEPTFTGPTAFRPALPALRSVVNYDQSEGVIGWYLGYDGDGCVQLVSDQTTVTVVIDHPTS